MHLMVAWVVINRQHPPAALFALPSAPLFPLPHLSPLLPTPYALLSATAARQPLCNQSVTHSFCLDGGCAPGVPPSLQRKEQKMTLASAKPSSTNHPRCRHFTADGRRCRLAVLDTRTNLCFRYSALISAVSQPPHNDSEDFSADLLPELSEFSAGTDIRQFLARLLTLVTKGRISPRRASVLAYVTNQLLHSHRAIFLETNAPDEEPVRIINDMPRPQRDWPDPVLPSHPNTSWLHPTLEVPTSKGPS